ncbi:ABC transporter substrate-binding protein [Roseinatronobacter alkalisoli]|uniref:Sugar ABC transporter substrate-binding protein n=1 Tax=Roseinatronobacter alkalisoli TaxID=3028235 RepID=A0ABT5TH69_9RHOB|nr:sugar ABC transporter substrate-binding protein [Roseinatronobacter sp. HJB301]MDD7973517.1 sugar ABC transporter substrate-binding protein [Roseinatronobacter sp. HJB301]
MTKFKLGLAAAAAGSLLATTAMAEDLSVWMRYGENERNVLDAVIAEFTAQTGIGVDLFLANTDFETRLARAAAGGNLPDVVVNDATIVGQLLEMGILSEIDRDSFKGADAIYDVAWESTLGPDGRHYGVPISAQAFAVFVRKDWREALGYDKPETWEDLFELARAFTEDDPNGNGKADTYGYVMPVSATRGYTSWFLSDLIWQAGGAFVEESNGTFRSTLGTQEVATAIEFGRSFICAGYAQPAAITATTGDATPVFSSGQAGIYRSGPYHNAPFSKEPGSDLIEVILPPAGPAGRGSLAEGEAAFITVTSKVPETAQTFIEFLVSESGQRLGMAEGMDSSPIVRLSVNKNVDTLAVRGDEGWATFAQQFAEAGQYFPRVPNWKPIRQVTADGFNRILADCSSDIGAALAAIDEAVNAELDRQDVLIK